MDTTPGPWTVIKNWHGKIAIVGPKNNGKSTTVDRICNLPQSKPDNARLIAAAPLLLDFVHYIAHCETVTPQMIKEAQAILTKVVLPP